jgi:REP element-mobilizing transposase RayT
MIGFAGGKSLRMYYQRKHIRLRDFDYSLPNAYFITICVKDVECLLGEIRGGVMGLSAIGNEAVCALQKIPELRPHTELDEFIIMPNHLHFVLVLNQKDNLQYKVNTYGQPVVGSISVIVNQFKGVVKKWCNANSYHHFEWQSRFYDHVIRDQKSYDNICNYISANPRNWKEDKYGRDLPSANPKQAD